MPDKRYPNLQKKYIPAKLHKTVKTQTNLPVKICYLKV